MPTTDPHLATELARGFTVADYERAASKEDRARIATALRARFHERYINPLSLQDKNKKHGFTLMAVSCLMVEALQSFIEGWPHTDGRSQRAICSFLGTAKGFESFRGHGPAFFKNVRCGILHQAETTGGWTISRTGPLFSPRDLRINATKFMGALAVFVDAYSKQLVAASWQDPVWQRARIKFNALLANCQR